MSGPRAKIIFHIGQHKTGSKALQSFLAHHAPALALRGICYPLEETPRHGIRAYSISHYRMFALLRREAVAACGETDASASWWEEQRAFCHPFDSLRGLFESLESERARTGAGTILLSAEDMFDMHSAHETGFSVALVEAGAKILAGLAAEFRYDPLVIVYLRRQDHLLGAHYVQHIKGSSVNDMDFETFARAFAPRLRSRDILAPWASAFGAGQIRVRPYEPAALPSGIVPDFFARFPGFPVPPDWEPPPRDPESVNATPGRDYVEFIRLLNRGDNRGLPEATREDVLEAALRSRESSKGQPAGIQEWLSPKARRALMETHARGNSAIADLFLGRPGEDLFTEPLPEDDAEWHEYPGLSAARASAIAQNIREIADRRLAMKNAGTRRRWPRAILRAFAGLSGRKTNLI